MSAPRPSHTTRTRRRLPRLAAAVALTAGAALALTAGPASAGIVPTVPLATSAGFSVLAGSAVTNTGPSVLGQSVGLSPEPASSITGFPPGTVVAPGTIQAANGVTLQAQSDLTIAYNNAAGRDVEFSHPNPDLVGQTLLPGVHAAAAMAPLELSGELVLDGGGNVDAVFIFQTDSTLITSTGSTIRLINGASECNVFWQVGSSATLQTGSVFVGTILALTSITVNTGAAVQGRALARNGAVTLDNNVFTQPSCVPTAITSTTTSSTTPGAATTTPGAATTTPGAATTTPATTPAAPTTAPTDSPSTSTPDAPIETTPPSTVFENPTTTFSFPVTDITLPRTGGSLTTQSGIALAAALLGLGAVMVARRRQPA